MNAHNPVNLTYGGKAVLMNGVGGGDCLRFSLTEPAPSVWDAQSHR